MVKEVLVMLFLVVMFVSVMRVLIDEFIFFLKVIVWGMVKLLSLKKDIGCFVVRV